MRKLASQRNCGVADQILLLAVILLVTLILVLTLILGAETNNGPATVFREYVDRLDKGDARGAANLTIHALDPNAYADRVDYLEGYLKERHSFSILSLKVVDKVDLSLVKQSEFDVHIRDIESSFGVDVADYCAISCTVAFNIVADSTEKPDSWSAQDLPCLKVGDGWYMGDEWY